MTGTSETAQAAPAMKPRPTSPHLSIYRLPFVAAILSIVHRLTGIALSFGLVFLAWWLLAVLYGPNAYAQFLTFSTSIVGKVFLVGWSWSLCYHMLNGIRHMFWDIGKGFEIQSFTQSGWMVVIGSIVLTAIIWVLTLSTTPAAPGVMYG